MDDMEESDEAVTHVAKDLKDNEATIGAIDGTIRAMKLKLDPWSRCQKKTDDEESGSPRSGHEEYSDHGRDAVHRPGGADLSGRSPDEFSPKAHNDHSHVSGGCGWSPKIR